MQSRSVRLEILVVQPQPDTFEGEPVLFGLQDKKQAVHPGVAQGDGSVLYVCETTVDFAGPFVHGKPGERFLYLSRRYRDREAPWIHRMKVPLGGLAPEAGATYRATVSATREDGRPACATVPLIGGGWQRVGE